MQQKNVFYSKQPILCCMLDINYKHSLKVITPADMQVYDKEIRRPTRNINQALFRVRRDVCLTGQALPNTPTQ